MSGLHPTVEKMLRDFYREVNIDEHEAKKAGWPLYGRFLHWLIVSWRCPACKAARLRNPPSTRALKNSSTKE